MASPSTPTEDLARLYERLPELVAGDAALVRRGRWLSGDMELGIGAVPLAVSFAEGRVTKVARGPFLLRPWVFAIRAEPEAWAAFLEAEPKPGSHDIMAMYKRGVVRIEGNLQPLLANLQYVKDVLALPRAKPAGR